MNSQYNIRSLEKIGTNIIYIGGEILEHDTDDYTRVLMVDNLIVGNIYTISGIREPMPYYCDHYFLKEVSMYCFPCNCFVPSFKNTYELK